MEVYSCVLYKNKNYVIRYIFLNLVVCYFLNPVRSCYSPIEPNPRAFLSLLFIVLFISHILPLAIHCAAHLPYITQHIEHIFSRTMTIHLVAHWSLSQESAVTRYLKQLRFGLTLHVRSVVYLRM